MFSHITRCISEPIASVITARLDVYFQVRQAAPTGTRQTLWRFAELNSIDSATRSSATDDESRYRFMVGLLAVGSVIFRF